MDRQEWLEARRKGVGGSDGAAILGVSKWRTPTDVYEDKLGISPERPATPAMQWGLALETAIADAYEVETGRRVKRVPGIRRARHVRDYPMIGSLDRVVPGELRLVELKTSRSTEGFGPRTDWEDLDPAERIPADYYVQVQHYLELMQYDFADVAVLFGGSDFRVYEIPRDPEFGTDLRGEEGDFWREYVELEVYPPATDRDLENLARRWTSSDDERVATAEETLLLDSYARALDIVDSAEANRDQARATIEERMGELGKLIAPSGTITWRSHARRSTAWKEYASVLEGVIARVRLNPTGYVGETFDSILSDQAGTTDLADVRGLYETVSNVRPFRFDRKEGGPS